MEKSNFLSTKDWIIKKMSVKFAIPILTLNKVIDHQFQSISDALITEKSVEISDFGKFIFRDSSAKKNLEKWNMQKEFYENIRNSNITSEIKKRNASMKLVGVLNNIEHLKKKKDGSF